MTLTLSPGLLAANTSLDRQVPWPFVELLLKNVFSTSAERFIQAFYAAHMGPGALAGGKEALPVDISRPVSFGDNLGKKGTRRILSKDVPESNLRKLWGGLQPGH